MIVRCSVLTQQKGCCRTPRKAAMTGFREVTASGGHRQIGLTIGKQCRDLALLMERQFKASLRSRPGMNLQKALSVAKKSLPLTRKFSPEYVEELEGYAHGTGVPFDVVYAMFHEHLGPGPGRGCTDIAVNSEWTKDDCVYAAHNDDVSPLNSDTLTISRIKPTEEPGFICLAYGGIQPTCGMNAAGISLTGNAVEHNDDRPGIPKEVSVRKVLGATSLHDALAASMPEARGNSYNNIVCDSSGEIYSMEGSATTFDPVYASEGWLVHTNHYLSPRMWRFEKDMHTRHSSVIRYNRAKRLFKRELGKVEVSTFKKVFSDHVGYPESICRHADSGLPEEDQTQTVFSAVYDLTNKAAWILQGNPCKGEYKKYEL